MRQKWREGEKKAGEVSVQGATGQERQEAAQKKKQEQGRGRNKGRGKRRQGKGETMGRKHGKEEEGWYRK